MKNDDPNRRLSKCTRRRQQPIEIESRTTGKRVMNCLREAMDREPPERTRQGKKVAGKRKAAELGTHSQTKEGERE